MCGIACVLHRDPRCAVARAAGALARLRHRGPDDQGIVVRDTPAGTLALAHARLAIRDLSAAGRQPMVDASSGTALLYNGELYNSEELRAHPDLRRVAWIGSSDTETLLHAYAAWGDECFARARGMFAAVIHDAQRGLLVLARDHLGIKPLYYAFVDGGLAIASEVQALAGCGLDAGAVDAGAVAGFLAYGAVPEPLTMLAGARALAPASIATIDLAADGASPERLALRRFWEPPAPQAMARDQAVAEVRQRLAHAVGSHLVADVPVGVFLSGGIDSTAIAALAAQARGGDLDALTVTFGGELDEGAVAARTAQALGIRHHRIAVSEHEILAAFASWIGVGDQPSVDGFNTFLVASATRARGFAVALSGLGGDELFAGYPSFRQLPGLLRLLRRTSAVPPWMRRIVARLGAWRATPNQRLKLAELVSAEPRLAALYLRRRRQFSDLELARLGLDRRRLALTRDWLTQRPPVFHARDDAVAAISALESSFYMGNMLLRDSDINTMAHGLELRVPFLDLGLVDFACRIPGALRIGGSARVNKPLLVEALRDLLPAEVTATRKRCFALPYRRWMLGPLRERFTGLIDSAAGLGVLDPAAVHRVWRSFVDDRSGSLWARAWMLGALGAWAERRSALVA